MATQLCRIRPLARGGVVLTSTEFRRESNNHLVPQAKDNGRSKALHSRETWIDRGEKRAFAATSPAEQQVVRPRKLAKFHLWRRSTTRRTLAICSFPRRSFSRKRVAPGCPIRRQKCRCSWELGTNFSHGQSDDRYQVSRPRNARFEGGVLRIELPVAMARRWIQSQRVRSSGNSRWFVHALQLLRPPFSSGYDQQTHANVRTIRAPCRPSNRLTDMSPYGAA